MAAEPNPLLTLLRRCVVQVEGDGCFKGTGFFVAPREVLTCAHVVDGCDTVTVHSESGASRVNSVTALPPVGEGSFYPYPDVALLQLADATATHPCVELDLDPPAGDDRFLLDGFAPNAYEPGVVAANPVTADYEGIGEAKGHRVYKLKGGQVAAGMSGAPALNLRRLRVCGIVDSSRGVSSDLGGFAVPVSSFLDGLPGLHLRSEAYHQANPAWRRAAERERVSAAERAGRRQRLPFHPAARPPSPGASAAILLQASRRLVPLVGRERLLRRLADWRESGANVAVAVLSGEGGSGKTRLAIEACAEAEQNGWTADRLSTAGEGTVLDDLASWPGRLFVTVDYAETRPGLVSDLLEGLMRWPDRPPTRVLLLARHLSNEANLARVFATGRDHEVVDELFVEPTVFDLRDPAEEVDRATLFATAVTAFARHRGAPVMPARTPDLRAAYYERPLMVLARALLFLDDPALDLDGADGDELLGMLLDREAQYWDRWDEQLKLGVDPEHRPQAVATAALLGAGNPEEALALVRLLDPFKDSNRERVHAVAGWLSSLYGSGRLEDTPAITPLEPDLLAEALVARQFAGKAPLVDAALDVVSDAQRASALVVLSRASAGRPGLAEVARPAIETRLPALVSRLSSMGHIDRDLLAGLQLAVLAFRPVVGAAEAMRFLPDDSAVAASLAAIVTLLGTSGLERAARQDRRFQPRLAQAFNDASRRWADLGDLRQALTAVDRSLAEYAELYATAAARYAVGVARALTNRSAYLGDLERPDEALVAIDEAIALYDGLDADRLDHYRPELAGALGNRAGVLMRLGRPEEAAASFDDAVGNYHAVPEVVRTGYLPEMASLLNNQSVCLDTLGRRTDALACIEMAVDVRRRLAEWDPDRYQAELVHSLINLSNRLDNVGRRPESREPAEEAVRLARQLCEAYGDRFRVELARALETASIRRADAGLPRDAMAALAESLLLHRKLVEANPGRFRPEEARLLANHSAQLAAMGDKDEALATAEQALIIRRSLVTAHGERFLPDLAASLDAYSSRLDDTGQPARAVTPIAEAVTIYRRLCADNSEAYAADLAGALHNLSIRLALYDPGEALTAILEAVARRRVLAEQYPDRFAVELANSLNSLSNRLGQVGRDADGLHAVDEAIAIYRAYADRCPRELASALTNRAERLGALRREDEAQAALREAEAIRRAIGPG